MKLWMTIISLVYLFSQNSFAYNFTTDFADGFYWQELPVNFVVADPNSQSGNYLHQVVDSAMSDWEDGLGVELWDLAPTVVSSASGKSAIRWTNNIEQTGFDSSTTLAVTLRYINGPYYVKSEILLNSKHPSMGNASVLRWTLVHELGHTLGLGHSDDPWAIMYYKYTGGGSLSNDDYQGMSAIVYETQGRQISKFVSPLTNQDNGSQQMACGTINLDSQGPGGPWNGLISLVLGLSLMLTIQLSRKTLPIRIS